MLRQGQGSCGQGWAYQQEDGGDKQGDGYLGKWGERQARGQVTRKACRDGDGMWYQAP